jgi:serine/threonine-protein kinase
MAQTPGETPTESVETLVARGDYAAAAARAAAGGQLARAIQLYERIWRFADAVPLALAQGDRPLAVRLALDAGDVPGALAIAAAIPADAAPALAAAATTLGTRGHHRAAAELHARAGRWADAAALYRKAGARLAAAGMLERAGQFQEAGRLYEQVASEAASAGDVDEGALAQLALGRLLGGLGRPLEATRALQAAARHLTTRAAAHRRLTAELTALGLRHAAAEIERRSQSDVPIGAAVDPAPDPAGRPGVDSALPVPRRFRVLQTLGAGALGRVYAAHDELYGRTVALKALSVGPGALGPERQAFLRFLREAEAIGRLRHPHIVALHELDEHAGLMVLEHLPGGTLQDTLARRGPLSPALARRLALDVLSALAVAHRAGVVHRDVTPPNVFFDAAGNAKLGDFGAAHLTDFGHTQTGSFLGTLAYLSPEQITGAPLGSPADLYGLGATLYEALTGRPPFLGPDVVGQHLAEAPTPPSALRPGLAPVHDEVLLRALAKAPADRYPSAEGMAEAVERWPAFDSQAARPTPPAAPPEPAATDSLAAPAERPLGRSARGQLVLSADVRVGRQVLQERLDRPLDEEERARLQRLAAAGGPRVQRILALAAGGDSITYEWLEGEPSPLATLPPDEVAALAGGWALLAAAGLPPSPEHPVMRTDGGPVILLVAPTTPR